MCVFARCGKILIVPLLLLLCFALPLLLLLAAVAAVGPVLGKVSRQKSRVETYERKKAKYAGGGGGEGSEEEVEGGTRDPKSQAVDAVMKEIDSLTREEQHEVFKRVVKRMPKPDKYFGEGAARMFEYALKPGISLNSTGPFVMKAVLRCTGVHLKNDLNISCSRNTVKLLAVGTSTLDVEEVIKAILAAPILLVARDESLRNGDEKFPIFVAFHDVQTDAPW